MSAKPPSGAFTGRRILLGVILLIGTGLRLFRLGADSLWYDETVSTYLAGSPLPELIRHTAGDIHPPGYYVLLRGWLLLTGYGTGHADPAGNGAIAGNGLEFASAFFSLFFGVLLIALVYVLARRFVGETAALVAAGLLALSPFNIWYSQEVRMYTLGAGIGVVVLWALAGEIRQGAVSDGFRAKNGTWAIYAWRCRSRHVHALHLRVPPDPRESVGARSAGEAAQTGEAVDLGQRGCGAAIRAVDSPRVAPGHAAARAALAERARPVGCFARRVDGAVARTAGAFVGLAGAGASPRAVRVRDDLRSQRKGDRGQRRDRRWHGCGRPRPGHLRAVPADPGRFCGHAALPRPVSVYLQPGILRGAGRRVGRPRGAFAAPRLGRLRSLVDRSRGNAGRVLARPGLPCRRSPGRSSRTAGTPGVPATWLW